MSKSLDLVLAFSFIFVCLSLGSYAEPLFGFMEGKTIEMVDFPRPPSPPLRGVPHSKACKKIPKYGRMTSLEVEPCEGNDRCPLIQGTNVTLKLEFTPFQKSEKLYGYLGGVMDMGIWSPTIPFGSAEDLCKSEFIRCPALSGQTYKYERTFFVKTSYPKRKLDVSIWVNGDEGEVACVLVPVEIKAPQKEKLVEIESGSFSWF